MVNYGTGAATAALPVELAKRRPVRKVGDFIAANGNVIPKSG